eukprot:1755343-Rhodomonas_salina.2
MRCGLALTITHYPPPPKHPFTLLGAQTISHDWRKRAGAWLLACGSSGGGARPSHAEIDRPGLDPESAGQGRALEGAEKTGGCVCVWRRGGVRGRRGCGGAFRAACTPLSSWAAAPASPVTHTHTRQNRRTERGRG